MWMKVHTIINLIWSRDFFSDEWPNYICSQLNTEQTSNSCYWPCHPWSSSRIIVFSTYILWFSHRTAPSPSWFEVFRFRTVSKEDGHFGRKISLPRACAYWFSSKITVLFAYRPKSKAPWSCTSGHARNMGDIGAFSAVAPCLWYSLPSSLRNVDE